MKVELAKTLVMTNQALLMVLAGSSKKVLIFNIKKTTKPRFGGLFMPPQSLVEVANERVHHPLGGRKITKTVDQPA